MQMSGYACKQSVSCEVEAKLCTNVVTISGKEPSSWDIVSFIVVYSVFRKQFCTVKDLYISDLREKHRQ